MSRELVIKINCDFCSKEVAEKDAQSGELLLNGKFYEFDLCPSCAPTLTDRLTPMPTSQAAVKTQSPTKERQKYKSTPKSERKVPCKICGVLCKNALGVRFHTVKMHPEVAGNDDGDNKGSSDPTGAS